MAHQLRKIVTGLRVSLFKIALFASICLTGCGEDEETPVQMPVLSVSITGVEITDNSVTIGVTRDSILTVEYSVAAENLISDLVVKSGTAVWRVDEAVGQRQFSGSIAVDLPYQSSRMDLEFRVVDGTQQEVQYKLTVDVLMIRRAYGGETDGVQWWADELSEGAILTMVDQNSRFGMKVNPLPMYFFDFSSGSAAPHPVYSRKSGNTIKQTVGAPSTEQIPPGKAQSWKAPLMDLPYGSSVVKIQDTDFAPGVSIFVRRFWTHDGNTEGFDKFGRFNHKLCRLFPEGSGINPYYQYDRLLMEQSPGPAAKYWDDAKYHTPFVRTWVLDEVRYVASSDLGTADASITLRRNGMFVDALVNTISRTADKPGQWRELAIDQIHNLSEVPEGFAVYYDMLAIDDTEQRVMLTNHKDLTKASEKEYLPAKSWTDGKIEVYLRQGTFSSLQDAYVCVQDENGNQIGEGIQLK